MSNGQELTWRLADLLLDPRETLEVELKGWLDISGNNEHKATLAKELIALANHGGGYVILGFSETEDGVTPTEPRPANLAGYTPDSVNSVVSRFADPAFHCDVHIEPPQSGQDWSELIGRCLANAREELADRFRNIMAGGVESTVAQTDLDRLSRWFDDSVDRWRTLTDDLPEGHAARFSNGYQAVGYQIVGDFDPPGGAQMLDALRNASRNKRGRPFWVPPQRAEPYMYGGNVECWLGTDGAPSLLDFWRVSPDAEFFLLRGHQEDGRSVGGRKLATLAPLKSPNAFLQRPLHLHGIGWDSFLGRYRLECAVPRRGGRSTGETTR